MRLLDPKWIGSDKEAAAPLEGATTITSTPAASGWQLHKPAASVVHLAPATEAPTSGLAPKHIGIAAAGPSEAGSNYSNKFESAGEIEAVGDKPGTPAHLGEGRLQLQKSTSVAAEKIGGSLPDIYCASLVVASAQRDLEVKTAAAEMGCFPKKLTPQGALETMRARRRWRSG